MGKDSELLVAARDGNAQAVKKLLSTKKGPLPALFALRKSADVNCKDARNGETPLHNAALNQHLSVVELLIENGASVNLTDNKGCSPLHLAAWNGNCHIAQLLITASTAVPEINAKNMDGDTPLCVASQYGHTPVAKLLLEFKADPMLRNKREESALDLAAMYGRLETVCSLIESSPDLLLQGSLHHTPLHLAARNGHKDVVRRLLQAGFNINAKTTAGTALHEAALFGKPEVVRLLLASGIDHTETDGSSKTVLEQLEIQRSQSSLATKQIIEEYLEEAKNRVRANTDPENFAAKTDDNGIYDTPALYSRVALESTQSKVWEGIYDTPTSHCRGPASTDETQSTASTATYGNGSPEDTPENDIYDCPRKISTDAAQLRQGCSSSVTAEECALPIGPLPLLGDICQAESGLSVPVSSLPPLGPSKPPRKKSDADMKRLPLRQDTGRRIADHRMDTTLVSPGEYVELQLPERWPNDGVAAGVPQPTRTVDKPHGIDNGRACDGVAVVRATECPTSVSPQCTDISEELPKASSARSHSASTSCLAAATTKFDDGVDVTASEESSTPLFSPVLNPDSFGNPFCGLRKGSAGLFVPNNQRGKESRILRRNQRSRTIAVLRHRCSLARSLYSTLQQQTLPSQQPVSNKMEAEVPGDAKIAVQTETGVHVEDEYEEWKQIATVVSSYGGRLSISFSVGNDPDFGKLFDEIDHIRGVGDWLAGFGMAQYENVLIANGFDNTDFLGGNILEEADLMLMGITNSAHINIILSQCSQLSPPAQICLPVSRNHCHQSSVSEWLESLQLIQYVDVFNEQGLNTIDQVLQLWERYHSAILGITLRGHQKRILASLRVLKESTAAWKLNVGEEDNTLSSQADAGHDTVHSETQLVNLPPLPDEKPGVLTATSSPSDEKASAQNAHGKSCATFVFVPIADEPALQQLDCLSDGKHGRNWTADAELPSTSASDSLSAPLNLPSTDLVSSAGMQRMNDPSVMTAELHPSASTSPASDSTTPFLPATYPRSVVNDDTSSTLALVDLGISEDCAIAERFEQCQWRHKPELLIKGCVNYSVVYLGTSAMQKVDGIEATKDAIDSIKAATASLPNSPTVILSISYKGVKFINAISKEIVCEHDIGNIYCVSQHADAMNFFAYSTKDHLSRKLYCHIFCAKSVELAREIILTLGEAFEVAYYASLKDTSVTNDVNATAAVDALGR